MKATPVRLNSEADKEFDLMIQSRKQHGHFLIADVLRFSKYFKGFERVTTRPLGFVCTENDQKIQYYRRKSMWFMKVEA